MKHYKQFDTDGLEWVSVDGSKDFVSELYTVTDTLHVQKGTRAWFNENPTVLNLPISSPFYEESSAILSFSAGKKFH